MPLIKSQYDLRSKIICNSMTPLIVCETAKYMFMKRDLFSEKKREEIAQCCDFSLPVFLPFVIDLEKCSELKFSVLMLQHCEAMSTFC